MGAKVTPMEKVIGLLKSLSAKVTADGQKDAAQYDKFACFCKEQADEKLYSIEKSDAKIEKLKAEIQELDSAIAELNSEISDLAKKISGLEADIKKKTETREKEHDEYLAKAKDMNEAIGACKAAIAALKDSKGAMEDAKVDFAQLKKVTAKVLGNQAPKFEYQSNDIIATLEDLLATFKSMKKDLDFEEHDINSAFESTKLGLSNEKAFAEKDKAEKEAVVESKTEELEAAKEDRDTEQNDRNADQAFMDELTKECEEKANLFDQRSKLRSEELTTLSEATAELQKGAAPNMSANKKLVGLQKKPAVVKKAAILPQPASFVQINSVKLEDSRKSTAIKKALDFLHTAGSRSGSTALVNAAMRVQMSEDHFVKVRALIKDIIQRLKDQAKAEASTKSVCDKGMTKAINGRDEAQGKIEVAEAKITTLTAKKEDLTSDINTLQAEIAELQKALLEATELRNDDKAEHTKVIGMSEEGIESVKMALNLLKEFYSKSALAQTGKYVPPNSDRDGNTVGDLAPEAFGTEYKGAQSESKGIIGILEVILSDFERTKGKTESDEKESKEAFEKFEKDTKADIKTKEDDIKKKEGELADAKSGIIDQQSDLADAKDLLESSLNKLDDLKAMCVAGEETWEERKKKREDEIEALKNALEILENWNA